MDKLILKEEETANDTFNSTQSIIESYKNFLNEGGTIITDNIEFHGMVGKSQEIESKNLRELVQKIENYIEYLKNNDEFNTEFLSIGDGLSVSTRKED